MLCHGFASAQGEIFGIVFGQHRRIVEINANRNVCEWIVRRGLICHDINGNIHREQLRNQYGGITDKPYREWTSLRLCFQYAFDRVI